MSADVAMDSKPAHATSNARPGACANMSKEDAFHKYGFWLGAVEKHEEDFEEAKRLFHTKGEKPPTEDFYKKTKRRMQEVEMILTGHNCIQDYFVLLALAAVWRERDEWEDSLYPEPQMESTSGSSGSAGGTEQERVCESGPV